MPSSSIILSQMTESAYCSVVYIQHCKIHSLGDGEAERRRRIRGIDDIDQIYKILVRLEELVLVICCTARRAVINNVCFKVAKIDF